MAGLLNLVPRYLPRYGMAPDWAARHAAARARLHRDHCVLITVIFEADVDAQGGAYATGVLVLMTSAAVAVTLSRAERRQRALASAFGLITAGLRLHDGRQRRRAAGRHARSPRSSSSRSSPRRCISRVLRPTELRDRR